jgi:ATP/maltotriose-dependent transcriptional regulator MalT
VSAWWRQSDKDAKAAEAELERVKREYEEALQDCEQAAERVKAERDVSQAVALEYRAERDKALTALREIANTTKRRDGDTRLGFEIARAALAEIEGETTFDMSKSPFPRPALESEEKGLWPDREIEGETT